ncbi:MAG: homoserine dehydrogenase [Candidatus Aminicenantes bacterium]|nr:MAG: homoserine dehydrogenase [Candidatus Aminicenantes bacterium]
MKQIPIILIGKGHVGKAFIELLVEKREVIKERYSLDFFLQGIFRSTGGAMLPKEEASHLFFFPDNCLESSPWWQNGYSFLDAPVNKLSPGVVVLTTVSSMETGEPGFAYLQQALSSGWHVVTADKGPLINNFRCLRREAERQGLSLKYSTCTAAALPSVDVALTSLAGAEIIRVEGILNGTTNFILSRMEEGVSFEEALVEAQSKGIAEPDPTRDLEGWDTAIKILLLAQTIYDRDFQLAEVTREGIINLPLKEVQVIKRQGLALKLLGIIKRHQKDISLEVKLVPLEKEHPLYFVRGPEKGISFTTDSMSQVTVVGGKSDPRGAAAALIKDMINIFSPM